jgi:hypothetical protein
VNGPLAVAAGVVALAVVVALVRESLPRPMSAFEGPIVGFRAWRIGRFDSLRSLTGGDHWGRAAHTAQCVRPLRQGERAHVAPDRGCACGNHALSSLQLARRAAAHTLRYERLALVLGLGFALVIAAGWLPAVVAVLLLLIERGRRRRSIVYGAVLAWGDVALDPVRGGIQVRSSHMRVVALVASPIADRAAAALGVPAAPEGTLATVALEITDGELLDPRLLGRGWRDSAAAAIGWAVRSGRSRLRGRWERSS